MDPRQFLRILRLRWPVVAVLVVLGAIAGFLSTPEGRAAQPAQRETTVYRATHLSFLDSPTPGGLTPAQIRFFVSFDDVPGRVAEKVGGDPAIVASQVQLQFDLEIGLLRTQSTNVDPERAALIANTYANELVEYLRERLVEEQERDTNNVVNNVRSLEERIRELDAQIAAASANEADLLRTERNSLVNALQVAQVRLQQLAQETISPTGIREARPAVGAQPISGRAYFESLLAGAEIDPDDLLRPPARPIAAIEPNPLLRSAAGAFAGFIAGIALIALLARLDNRIRSRDDAEEAFGLPVLAEIPPLAKNAMDAPISAVRPRSKAAEAHRALRTALIGAGPGRLAGTNGVNGMSGGNPVRVVMVCSPDPGDGKSTTTANLAVVLAEAGMRVLVIDCDFRRPRIAQLLPGADGPSFGPAPIEAIEDSPASYYVPTSLRGVSLARTVKEGEHLDDTPSVAIAAQVALIRAAVSRFDVVLLDTAPMLSTNDAFDLLPVTDAVVFVSRVGQTRRADAEAAAEQFERLRAPMAGTVLVGSVSTGTASRYQAYYEADDAAAARAAEGSEKAEKAEKVTAE